MAALCTGISYGLSQIQNTSTTTDGKELIFVKLTDSAYRAIEEFQRNQVSLKIIPFLFIATIFVRKRKVMVGGEGSSRCKYV